MLVKKLSGIIGDFNVRGEHHLDREPDWKECLDCLS